MTVISRYLLFDTKRRRQDRRLANNCTGAVRCGCVFLEQRDRPRKLAKSGFVLLFAWNEPIDVHCTSIAVEGCRHKLKEHQNNRYFGKHFLWLENLRTCLMNEWLQQLMRIFKLALQFIPKIGWTRLTVSSYGFSIHNSISFRKRTSRCYANMTFNDPRAALGTPRTAQIHIFSRCRVSAKDVRLKTQKKFIQREFE